MPLANSEVFQNYREWPERCLYVATPRYAQVLILWSPNTTDSFLIEILLGSKTEKPTLLEIRNSSVEIKKLFPFWVRE